MPLDEYINKPFFVGRITADLSGDLETDILRAQKENNQSRREIAASDIFLNYSDNAETIDELVKLFDTLLVFFDQTSNEENPTFGRFRRRFLGALSAFDIIPENIKERAREEFSKIKETYEMNKCITTGVLDEVMSKPSK